MLREVLKEKGRHEVEPGKYISAVVGLDVSLVGISGEMVGTNDQTTILTVTNFQPIVVYEYKFV